MPRRSRRITGRSRVRRSRRATPPSSPPSTSSPATAMATSSGTTGAPSGAPFPVHELALLLPVMTDEERGHLRDDIRANGLVDPITLHDGQVLDGRHRQDICVELGVPLRTVEFEGESPAAYVMSRNVNRRMLTTSQRAMGAADLVPYLEAGAKAR